MFFQQRTNTETGIMAFSHTDGHIRRDTFTHSPQSLGTFGAGRFFIPGDIQLCQPFGHLHCHAVVQHGMRLDHNIELRSNRIADSFRYIESQVLLLGCQSQIRGQVFAIEIIGMCKRVEFQSGESCLFYFQGLLRIIFCIMATTGKPIVCIQQNIFTISTSQQFITGNTQHFRLQV